MEKSLWGFWFVVLDPCNMGKESNSQPLGKLAFDCMVQRGNPSLFVYSLDCFSRKVTDKRPVDLMGSLCPARLCSLFHG